MLAPGCIRKLENEDTKAISEKASAALRDESLNDEQADEIIVACNLALTACGMPTGARTVTRALQRATRENKMKWEN